MIQKILPLFLLVLSCKNNSEKLPVNSSGYLITQDTIIDTIAGAKTIYNSMTPKQTVERKTSQLDASIKFHFLKITTDKNFQNYLSFELENLTDKTITNVAFRQGNGNNDMTNIEVDLPSKVKKMFKVSTKLNTDTEIAIRQENNFFGIEKIRFEDGSLLTR